MPGGFGWITWRCTIFVLPELGCHGAGGELEQIQFLLGHASAQTTERYIGCRPNFEDAVADQLQISVPSRWPRLSFRAEHLALNVINPGFSPSMKPASMERGSVAVETQPNSDDAQFGLFSVHPLDHSVDRHSSKVLARV
jgi:hypothetical protein